MSRAYRVVSLSEARNSKSSKVVKSREKGEGKYKDAASLKKHLGGLACVYYISVRTPFVDMMRCQCGRGGAAPHSTC